MAAATDVLVGKPAGGDGIAAAPLGTTLPTDTTTALNAAFKKLGYVSDDGLTETESRDTDTITAWGGITVASTQTSFEKQFQFTIISFLSADAQAVLRGTSNVTVTPATSSSGTKMTIKETAALPPNRSWVIDIVAGTGAKVRFVIPNGRVTESGDISWTDSDPAGLDMTVTAYADGSGVYVYVYTDDGVFTA